MNVNPANSSTTTTSNTMMSGLVSGMDTDSMVKQMLSGTQKKIDKQEGLKKQAQWKQEAYHDVITSIHTFQGQFFDRAYDSKLSSNLLSEKFFNARTSSVQFGSDVSIISSTPNANIGKMRVSVKQMASASSLSSTTPLSGDQTIKGSSLDEDALSAIKTKLADGGTLSFSVTLDGSMKDITLKQEDVTDADGNITIDSLQAGLQKKLDYAHGAYITVGKTGDGNGLTFSMRDPDAKGHEIRITGSEAKLLGIEPGSSTLVSTRTKLEDMADGDTFSFEINGEAFSFNKTDTLGDVILAVNRSDAGVTLTYSGLTDTISATTNQTGANIQLDMQETSGNLLANLFGETQFNGGKLEENAVTKGTDAKLIVDGNEITRSSNTVTLEGISMELLKVSDSKEDDTFDETVIGTDRDTDQIVDALKKFVDSYNTMLDKLNGYVDEKPNYRKYAPLTDEQEKEMSDHEIELWNEKTKEGLLHNDETIENYLSEMRSAMYQKCEKAGLALYDIGIETTTSWRDKGKLTIDEDCLRNMLSKRPDDVVTLFTDKEDGLSNHLNDITDRYAKLGFIDSDNGTADPSDDTSHPSELVGLAGADNFEINKKSNTMYYNIQSIEDRLKTLRSQYEQEEARYWKQFNSMEQILSTYNSQGNMFSQWSNQ